MKKIKQSKKDDNFTGNESDESEPLKSRQLKASKEKYNKDYSQSTLETSAAEVEKRLKNGCECPVSCFQDLDPEMVYKHRLNIAELTKNEQDFYLMGIVRAVLMDTRERGSKRQRQRSSYSYMGKKVCLYAFLYLENVTIYQLKKIRSHVMKNGVSAIQHGNAHKIPHNAFSLDMYKKVETFLRSYLNIDKNHPTKTIMLNQPLSKVYQEFKAIDDSSGADGKLMGYTTFRTFFKKQFPHVRLQNQVKPQTSTSDKNPAGGHLQQQQQQHMQVIEGQVLEIGKDGRIINTDDLIYYDAELSHEEVIN